MLFFSALFKQTEFFAICASECFENASCVYHMGKILLDTAQNNYIVRYSAGLSSCHLICFRRAGEGAARTRMREATRVCSSRDPSALRTRNDF